MAKIPSLCGAIWRTILNFYATQGVWVNCYRIHQKSLNFIYPFKFYSNFTNKNVSWLHFSWATQYVHRSLKLLKHLRSASRQPPSTCCSKVSARYVRSSHLRCLWTNDVELVPKQHAWAGHANWLFTSYTEDVSFWTVLGTSSALEALFCNDVLHNLTLTITLTLIYDAWIRIVILDQN